MRARTRPGVALLLLPIVVGAGLALDRAQPRPRASLPPRVATSGTWFCPHGGGSGWRTALYVVNPGEAAVQVRVTPLAQKPSGAQQSYRVDPGTELRIPVPSDDAAASSFLEYFGGWVAASWVTDAGGEQTGVAAEPCAPEPGVRWLAPDGSTEQGEDADVVVMNPFDVDAVIDVAVFSERPAPIRDSMFTNVRVPPHRSVILRLSRVSLDEPAASAEVVARTGRVVVASLGISRDGGIRSALAVTAAIDRVLLAGTGDVGQSTLVVMAPGGAETTFGATLLSGEAPVSGEEPQAAGGLTEETQGGQSARAFPLITQDPSLVDVQVEPGTAPIAAARRTVGQNGDPGATGGAAAPAPAWVIPPTVADEPSFPGAVLANPGASQVEVTLSLLGESGILDEIVVSVPALSAVRVPAQFLDQDPTAAVLAVAADGSFVAAGASSSLGREGTASYAVAAGIPVPPGVLAGA
jgi:hypothetical protein